MNKELEFSAHLSSVSQEESNNALAGQISDLCVSKEMKKGGAAIGTISQLLHEANELQCYVTVSLMGGLRPSDVLNANEVHSTP